MSGFVVPLDLKNPKTNTKTAGFTREERDGFTALLGEGFVDSFRHLHPNTQAFTYWSYRFNARAKNIGWYVHLVTKFNILPKFLLHN